MFNFPTYIVLEIPSPAAEKIQLIRSWFDTERAEMPVEITVAGSSGLGTIAESEDPQKVFSLLTQTAARLKPFRTSLGRVERFPDSETFYFTLSSPEKFIEIHGLIASSGIKFNATPYPVYKPHCTLKLFSESSEQEIRDLLNMAPLNSDFLIDTLSVYSLRNETSSECLFSAKLGTPVS